MLGATVAIAMFATIPTLTALGLCGQGWRALAFVMRFVLRRQSIAAPVRQSLLSPVMGADWTVTSDSRIDAENKAAGVRAWAYDFSAEAHLFHGREEIILPMWEQYILNRALRRRAKVIKAEFGRRMEVVNHERMAQLIDGLANAGERHIIRH